jgi:hypothetical protein
LKDSIVYHGPTEESVRATFDYMLQWEYGETAEEYGEPSGCPFDRTWVSDCGGYILTASLSYGYIGLERIVTPSVESYRCPCCGTDVMDSRPVCEDCRKADCQETRDACGELGYSDCQRADAYPDGAE